MVWQPSYLSPTDAGRSLLQHNLHHHPTHPPHTHPNTPPPPPPTHLHPWLLPPSRLLCCLIPLLLSLRPGLLLGRRCVNVTLVSCVIVCWAVNRASVAVCANTTTPLTSHVNWRRSIDRRTAVGTSYQPYWTHSYRHCLPLTVSSRPPLPGRPTRTSLACPYRAAVLPSSL